MMSPINKYVLLLLFGWIVSVSAVNAQRPLDCANGRIDTAAANRTNNFQKLNNTLSVNHLVRVFFHNVANDDGSNGTITTAEIENEFTTLQASYAADNICFLNAGNDIVKNTFLNIYYNADNDPTGYFFNPYQVPNCINIFYTQKINGNNTACNPPCGYGGIAIGGIPGTFFLVAKSNIGSGSTISHEMGHNLGLFHTFEPAAGFENINGLNATTSGDMVQDTPADPFAYNGLPCYATGTNKCTYTGNCPDPNGAKNFNPPYSNLMAYWWNGKTGANFFVDCYPALSLTNGQYSRVNATLASYIPLIGCSSADDVTQTGISVSTGYYMNSAIYNFITGGSVTFSGNTVATIGGGKVYLESGFHAIPGVGGITRIKAKPCNE